MRKPTQERKSEIVDAALVLSADVGPGKLTTEALAKRVGVSHGAIFRHFPNKAAIWSAVFDAIANRMEAVWATVDKRTHPTKRLCLLIQAQLKLVTAVPALPTVIFSRELHNKDAGISKGVKILMGHFHDVLKSTVQAGIDRGELRDDLDAGDVAYMIIAIMQGTVLRWTLADRKFDLVNEGSELTSLAINGLKPE